MNDITVKDFLNIPIDPKTGKQSFCNVELYSENGKEICKNLQLKDAAEYGNRVVKNVTYSLAPDPLCGAVVSVKIYLADILHWSKD